MQIVEIQGDKMWKLFHSVPHRIYAHDPNWVCPLEGDIQSVFNPASNKTFEHGEAQLFVLLDDQAVPAGRIAAFIDHHHNQTQPYPVGGIGFFECIDNPGYAAALLEKAESWLLSRGAHAVDGPINFGERDRYWGLLDKGFDMPLFQENYQPRYYKAFFENNGYIPFEQILTLTGLTADIPFERMSAVANRIRRDHDVRIERYHPAHIDRYANDFCIVYNASFRHFQHFKPIHPEKVRDFLHDARFILDPELLCIGYFEGKPAGFCLLLPDINPLLRPFRGKLNLLDTLRFLWHRRTTRQFRAKGIGFGIHPDYKSKGLMAFFLEFMSSQHNLSYYKEMYLTGVRAHNREIRSIYDKMAVHTDRVHVTYRKALSPGIQVEPFEFLETGDLPPQSKN